MNKKIVMIIILAVAGLGLATVCAISAGGMFWFWLNPPVIMEMEQLLVDVELPAAAVEAVAPEVDFAPRPELWAEIRHPAAFVGEPVIMSVRLRNPGALAAAHSTEAEMVAQPLSLHGNWRDFVELTVARFSVDGQTEPAPVETALLKPGPIEPETELGVRALAAVWVLSPESTVQLEPGDYRVLVRLNSAELLTEDYPNLETQVDFTLVAPDGSADTARLAQSIAFYYFNQNNCEMTLEHALKAIELDPAGYPAYWYAAECYAATDQTIEAAALLETLLAVMPPNLTGSDYHAAVKIRLAQLQGR